MARGKKRQQPPATVAETSTAVMPPEEDRKQYEVVEPIEVHEEGSDEVIEMPADGRIDVLLTDAEAAPGLEAGVIRLRENDSGLAPILIEVVAPSLNRPVEAARLEQALAACTIPEGYELKINVHRETEPRPLPIIVNELVAQSEAAIVVVLADHIVPHPDFIFEIVKSVWADGDCMIGLNIANMEPLPGVREYCFFAVGRKFIERFPNRQILCPDYYHFYGDTELGRFATEAGAFYFAEEARIDTHHVNTGLADPDATWHASRSRKKEDQATFERRQAAGLLWGRTFDRVNP